MIPDTVVKTALILYGTCFNPVSVAWSLGQTQLAVAVPAIKKRRLFVVLCGYPHNILIKTNAVLS